MNEQALDRELRGGAVQLDGEPLRVLSQPSELARGDCDIARGRLAMVLCVVGESLQESR